MDSIEPNIIMSPPTLDVDALASPDGFVMETAVPYLFTRRCDKLHNERHPNNKKRKIGLKVDTSGGERGFVWITQMFDIKSV